MGEGLKQMIREASSSRAEDEEDELGGSSSPSGDSDGSTSSSSDLTEDATSPSPNLSSNSPSPPSNFDSRADPLYEFSSLVSQLPIKRGLSKYYQGKSQSFSSLSDVRCVEDLPKKQTPYRRKMMKPCKSYAGGLDNESQTSYCSPGPYRKASPPRSSCASLVGRRTSSCGKPPSIPMQKNM